MQARRAGADADARSYGHRLRSFFQKRKGQVSAMNMLEIITRKKLGQELTGAEIAFFVRMA